MNDKMRFSYVDPRILKANSWNPNEMSPEAEAKLRNSLEQNGHVRPILVRELDNDTLEIVGGCHRAELSIELGHDTVPVLNLGKITDQEAKRILMLDNARYGEDEATKLAELLGDLGQDADEIATWLNMELSDIQTLVGSTDDVDAELAALDALEDYGIDDDEELTTPTKEIQTHQTMKFKVPVEDADFIKDVIEKIVRNQKLDDSDSAVRAGDALMWVCRDYDTRTTPDPKSDIPHVSEEFSLHFGEGEE